MVTCGGAVTDEEAGAVFDDLARQPALLVALRMSPLAAPVWTREPRGFTVTEHTTHVLDLTGGFDHVWGQRFRGNVRRNVRRNVRKAERSSLDVEVDRSGRLVPPPPHPGAAAGVPPPRPHREEPRRQVTGGVVVLHEQVLRVIDAMTGCGLDEAEKARRTLGDEVLLEEVREQLCALARPNGYDETTVARVWEVLAVFGSFGFCKAHAASFVLPTYQSAWLKRHHTAAFFASVLTHGPGMYPKRVILDDARHFGVEILPLDVNASADDWRIERTGGGGYALRVALSEVKGVSAAEVERIVAGRSYHSLADFWHRAAVSRPVVERIIVVGGFDALYGIRRISGPARRLPGRVTRRDLLA